jgi:hypothetical protein
MDRLWICRETHFQLEALAIVTMMFLKKWLAEGIWMRKILGVLYNSRKLGLSLKLDPRCLDRVLNSVSVFYNFQIHIDVKKLGPSLKLDPGIRDWVWNSIQARRVQNRDTFTSFLFFSFIKIKKSATDPSDYSSDNKTQKTQLVQAPLFHCIVWTLVSDKYPLMP